VPAQKDGAVQCPDPHRLLEAEARLDEQLDLADTGEAGKGPAGPGRVGSREQQSARLDEHMLEPQILREARGAPAGVRDAVDEAVNGIVAPRRALVQPRPLR